MKPLFDMLGSSMGQAALGQIAQRAGLSPAQAQMAMQVLVPAITGGMRNQAQANPAALTATLAKERQAAASPGQAASDAGVQHGNEVLGTVFGSKDVSRTVAQHASTQTGIDASKLKALLPMAAALAAGTAAKHAAPSAAAGRPASDRSGGLIGMLDADGDENPLDDILGMAGKSGFR